jgi:hypothetical protein
MSKTPEELAEEYLRYENESHYWAKHAFLAGYQAAATEYQEKLNQIRLDRPAFKKHEIENLLSQANSDGFKRGYEQGKIVQSEWISVKDKLPDSTPMVLAKCIDGYELAYYGNYGKGQWTNTLGTEHLNVTHWMPLPAPPKEEE